MKQKCCGQYGFFRKGRSFFAKTACKKYVCNLPLFFWVWLASTWWMLWLSIAGLQKKMSLCGGVCSRSPKRGQHDVPQWGVVKLPPFLCDVKIKGGNLNLANTAKWIYQYLWWKLLALKEHLNLDRTKKQMCFVQRDTCVAWFYSR